MPGIKNPHDDEDKCEVSEEHPSKAKRHDIEPPPLADVDVKLAERLDKILTINDGRKPKFFTNKPKNNTSVGSSAGHSSKSNLPHDNKTQPKIKTKNLSKDELRERLLQKYDTLVPELDPKRPQVKLIKILSASESIELAKSQAKKQLERQMELNSVSKNQAAHKNGLDSFRFDDGYGMEPKKSADIISDDK